jgi:hypothetical protein
VGGSKNDENDGTKNSSDDDNDDDDDHPTFQLTNLQQKYVTCANNAPPRANNALTCASNALSYANNALPRANNAPPCANNALSCANNAPASTSNVPSVYPVTRWTSQCLKQLWHCGLCLTAVIQSSTSHSAFHQIGTSHCDAAVIHSTLTVSYQSQYTTVQQNDTVPSWTNKQHMFAHSQDI